MGGGFLGDQEQFPGSGWIKQAKKNNCMDNLEGFFPSFFLVRIVWVGVIKRHLVCHMAFLDFFSWARIDKLSILEFITMKNRRKHFLKVQGVSFCPQKMCLQKTLKTYRNLENTVRNYWCLRCFRDKKPVVLFFREFLCFETSSCFLHVLPSSRLYIVI